MRTKWAALIAIGASAACGITNETSTTAAATTAAAAGTGGAGGAASTGGATSAGGAGGAALPCLEASAYADLFTDLEAGFCVVARYDANEPLGYQLPSWGRHGGPLTVKDGSAAGSVELTRWSLPSGATGMLTPQATTIAANISAGAFLGAQAIDTPFFAWTLVSYTSSMSTVGELIAIKNAAVEQRWPVNGFYAGATIAAMAQGRLLYSGLSVVGDASGDANGLYAADACGTANSPNLVPNGDPTCGAPTLVSAWDDASGPVGLDADGNAFAVMTSFAGDQEARAFAASSIAPGAPPTEGTTLFKLPGFGASLAAIAANAMAPGVVVFQPWDSTSAAPLDPIAQPYAASSTGIAPNGMPATFFKLATAGTGLGFMLDEQGRLWVAVSGMSSTTYAVVARH